jgi:hypothetical protein
MLVFTRLKLAASKFTAVYIQKLAYSLWLKPLSGLSGTVFLALYIMSPNILYCLLFVLLLAPCIAAFLMKPYDNIIVTSRVTGSPHVLIRNREAIGACFCDGKLNNMLLLKLIRESIFKYLDEYSRHSKRKYIATTTHKVMFRSLGLDKLCFIRDVKEARAHALRDKLLFISFREIFRREDLNNLIKKVPYYKFKIDMEMLRESIS